MSDDLTAARAEIARLRAQIDDREDWRTPAQKRRAERNAAIIAAARSGVSIADICLQFGISRPSYQIIARKGGITNRHAIYDHEAIIAAVKAGVAIKDCGVPYGVASLAVRTYERATGERLPRSPRGAPARTTVSAREANIIATYRELQNMRAVGDTLGISRERVRKIINRYERLTGEAIPHAPRGTPGERVARVIWKCARCGTERRVRPSDLGSLREYCLRCHHRLSAKFLSDQLIEDTIAARLAGEKWRPLGIRAGYVPSGAHSLESGIYRAVQYQGKYELIPRLWPKGIPHWLQKHTIKPKDRAA